MRASGILLPVFSLPSAYGIGCFSKAAYDFIDRLSASRQHYWQILPLGPAGGWDSPYMPLSCFAGDPIYIDPDTLYQKKLLHKKELPLKREGSEFNPYVDYNTVRAERRAMLQKAFSRFKPDADYEAFYAENAWWLKNYALYMVLREASGGAGHLHWTKPYRSRDPKALEFFARTHDEQIRYILWTQYEFFSEWGRILQYAHTKNVEIIGDIPIYVSPDSTECWAEPKNFQLDKNLMPKAVAGCPPDGFAPDGQKWGNPLYNWTRMEADGFSWWKLRLRQCFKMYDLIRIDHTRGFQAYFSIPNDGPASEGHWRRGPGMHFFREIEKEFGSGRFIAEDLGHITPGVRRMVREAKLPGMKVLQFAFDGNPKNPYLPGNFDAHCVIYTGTHDNDTTRGWYASLDYGTRKQVTHFIRSIRRGSSRQYEKAPAYGASQAARALISVAFHSDAEICIIPMQDHLLLDTSARVNTPGTVGGRNWQWRMPPDAFSDELVSYLVNLTMKSERC